MEMTLSGGNDDRDDLVIVKKVAMTVRGSF